MSTLLKTVEKKQGVDGTGVDERALLRAFVKEGSGEAFRCLVSRYGDLVYGSALRQVREAAMADDVTQAVFIVLARKARWLGGKVILGGWLMRVTRFAAKDALKREGRRRKHERAAAGMRQEGEVAMENEGVRESGALLDIALARLNEGDRNAIVLRYLEGRSPAEVGTVLRISEVAARQRCSRAVGRLRKEMRKEGVGSGEMGAAGMGSVMAVCAIKVVAPYPVVHAAWATVATGKAVGMVGGGVSAGHVIAHAVARSMMLTKMAVVGGGVAIAVVGGGVAYRVHVERGRESVTMEKKTVTTETAEGASGAAIVGAGPVASKGSKMPRTLTPLIWAIERHQTTEAKGIIDSGADVNAISTDGNNTSALLYVANYPRDAGLEIVKALVEHGADVNMRNGQGGYSALQVAAEENSIETVGYLLAHGAEVNIRSKKGDTALSKAKERGNAAMVRVLTEAGAK